VRYTWRGEGNIMKIMDVQAILNECPVTHQSSAEGIVLVAIPPVPSIPPSYRGLIASPQPTSSPLAYDENVIVNLIIQIFDILISLGHIPQGWSDFAPENGHRIDEAVCAELGLTPRVVSLMKKLPYISSERTVVVQMLPQSYMPNYRNSEHIRASRNLFL
jgi:hypothetical protein